MGNFAEKLPKIQFFEQKIAFSYRAAFHICVSIKRVYSLIMKSNFPRENHKNLKLYLDQFLDKILFCTT